MAAIGRGFPRASILGEEGAPTARRARTFHRLTRSTGPRTTPTAIRCSAFRSRTRGGWAARGGGDRSAALGLSFAASPGGSATSTVPTARLADTGARAGVGQHRLPIRPTTTATARTSPPSHATRKVRATARRARPGPGRGRPLTRSGSGTSNRGMLRPAHCSSPRPADGSARSMEPHRLDGGSMLASNGDLHPEMLVCLTL